MKLRGYLLVYIFEKLALFLWLMGLEQETIEAMEPTARRSTLADFEEYWRLCVAPFGVDEIHRPALWEEYVVFCSHPVGMSLIVTEGENRGVFFMAGIFITDEFVSEIREASEPFVCARFVRWLKAGRLPFPDREDVGRLNADGLNLLFTAVGWDHDADLFQQARYLEMGYRRFLDRYGGWQLKAVYGEPIVEPYRQMMEGHGYHLANGYEDYNAKWANPQTGFHPALYCVTKEQAAASSNYGLLNLFVWQPPRCRFTRTQRQIIRLGIRNLTDKEIAKQLGRTVGNIKQHWQRIYDHFEKHYPGELSDRGEDKRSTERRRKVIAFLADRMYELRPYKPAKKLAS